MILSEIQHIRPGDGPVVVYARHHGVYRRPVLAYELDMRLEDNPAVPRQAMRQDASWVARHPTEPLFIVYDGLGGDCRMRVPKAEMGEWALAWRERRARWSPRPGSRGTPPPERIISLPDDGAHAWWEWVQAFDDSRDMVKAAKRPRPGEPGPEEVDERGGEHASAATRIGRVYAD